MKKHTNSSGYTLLEVLLAMLVFSIISVSIMSIIGNVDRMRIRNKKRNHATLIASNASEILKYYGRYSILNDSVYIVNVNGSEYNVERIRLESYNDSLDLHPVEIKVSKNGQLVKRFKMLQGVKGNGNE